MSEGGGKAIDLSTLPGLPVGWVWCVPNDFCSVVASGSTPSPDKMFAGQGDVPFLKVYNLTHHGALDFGTRPTFIGRETHTGPQKRSIAKPGDVLINIVGPPLGKVSLVPDDFPEWNINQAIVLFRPHRGILNKYLAYAFLTDSIMKGVTRLAKATAGQFNIGVSMCRTLFPIPIAPLNEQQRIVETLDELFSDLDAGVAALERVRTKLGHYRAAVLKAAVEGALTAEWRKQHPATEPASALLTRILAERRRRWEQDQLRKFAAADKQPPTNWKASHTAPVEPDAVDLPPIADGWIVTSMDAMTSRITSGSRDWQQYYGSGTGTFIMAQNVRPGRLDLNTRQTVNPPPNDPSCARSQVEQDDLLITIVGANTGDVCRVPEHLPEHWVCQSVTLMRPVDSATAKFLDIYCNSPSGAQFHYHRYIYGAGRPHLSFDQIKMTPVLLPPLAEQEAIVEAVEDQLSVIEHIEADVAAKLKSAQALRQSILRHAFTGQLVPQDPHDEPASELLKRIAADRDQRTRLLKTAKAAKQPPAASRGRKKSTP